MNEKELNKTLKSRARELGLCDQWYKDWESDSTQQELVGKYLKGIDFCIKHDYPKLPFIREYFHDSVLVRNGIFLDKEVSKQNLPMAVFLGESKGTIGYDGFQSGNIYVRHQSQVEIIARNGARVFVEAYEHCRVKVTSDEWSKVFVYWHGGEIERSGHVVVRDRR